jgi:hypothetical protein
VQLGQHLADGRLLVVDGYDDGQASHEEITTEAPRGTRNTEKKSPIGFGDRGDEGILAAPRAEVKAAGAMRRRGVHHGDTESTEEARRRHREKRASGSLFSVALRGPSVPSVVILLLRSG